MLLVAHELGPLEPLIDRAVVVHEGRIAHARRGAGAGRAPRRAGPRPRAPARRPGTPGHLRMGADRPDGGELMDLFTYDFMLRALAGALIIGVTAPALGIYLVQRRLSLIGDGIGHVALTGVGVGLLLHQSPVITAVIVAAIGAVGVELVRERGRTSGDLALALLFYGGIAGGVVLVGLSDGQQQRQPGAVPVRLADHHVGGGPAGDRGARRRGAARHAAAAAGAVRGLQRRGVRAGLRPARTHAQSADGGDHRGDRHDRHAHRGAAADQRADGGAGGGRPAGHPRVPHHDGGGDGDRRGGGRGRRGGVGRDRTPRPARPS